MKDLIAKCGCNCSKCPTYKENLRTLKDRENCSRGFERYLGARLKPEKLRLCDGCTIQANKRKVYYVNCIVRKCAFYNGIENCAYCSEYPCGDVLTLHETQKPDAPEKIAERLGNAIPKKDYLAFIEPFEGIKHLNEIRKSLKSEDIVKLKAASVKPKIIDFPDKFPYSKNETKAFKFLHTILSSLETAEKVSFARHIILQKNRKHLLKILWAFGEYGEWRKNGDLYLILNSEIYAAMKISSYHSKVLDYFNLLKKYDVNCKIVPVIEKGWLTPTGGLRKKGWFMRMSFDDNTGEINTLKALKSYVLLLEAKYSKNAFRYFSKGDMRVLVEERS